MKVLLPKRFVAALYERRMLSAVADHRYSILAFGGTEPVPPIILGSAVVDRRYRRRFVL